MSCNRYECQECMSYEANVRRVCEEALLFFRQRERPKLGESLVIFDIDGTALDERHSLKKKGMMPRHHPVYGLYEEVIKLGYVVIFLTGRLENYESHTSNNLHAEGYGFPDVIYCPVGVNRTPVDVGFWKDKVRGVLKEHYVLVACIGDQPMDVYGEHIGEKQFLLPLSPTHQVCTIQ